MTTITSGFTSQYYQLPGQSGQTARTSLPSAASSLSLADPANLSADNNAYLLDLSPQAQDYLKQSDSPDASFVLTNQQWRQIGEILGKYKDAPLTQETYNQIQDELQAAGLSPDQLAQQDSFKSFNATQLLIDALNGKADPIETPGSSNEQTKSKNYMQQIYKQWQSIASASSPADDSLAPTS